MRILQNPLLSYLRLEYDFYQVLVQDPLEDFVGLAKIFLQELFLFLVSAKDLSKHLLSFCCKHRVSVRRVLEDLQDLFAGSLLDFFTVFCRNSEDLSSILSLRDPYKTYRARSLMKKPHIGSPACHLCHTMLHGAQYLRQKLCFQVDALRQPQKAFTHLRVLNLRRTQPPLPARHPLSTFFVHYI